MSLEEQRQRQEDEAKRVQVTSLSEGQPEPVGMDVGESTLASALGQSLPTAEVVAATDGPPVSRNLFTLTLKPWNRGQHFVDFII